MFTTSLNVPAHISILS